MAKKNIVLITRTWSDKDIKEFIERIHTSLDRIVVLVNVEKEPDHYTQTLLRGCTDIIFNKIEIVHVKPWGVASGALNIGLTKAFNHKPKPDYFLIVSKEVNLDNDHVSKMSRLLSDDEDNMLVVGYHLIGGHDKNDSIVYKVPWNTCAMWNAKLFYQYVGAFNVICDCSQYLGKIDDIPLRGMEDALAIALARKDCSRLQYKLILDSISWKIKPERIKEHNKKMERKALVYKEYERKFKLSNCL